MLCTECKSRIRIGLDKFCPSCGKPVKTPSKLLEADVILRGGFLDPKVVVALFDTHILISDNRGKSILKASLKTLERVRHKPGIVYFKVDGRKYRLQFTSSIRLMFLGLLGSLTDPGRKKAKEFVRVISEQGVVVG